MALKPALIGLGSMGNTNGFLKPNWTPNNSLANIQRVPPGIFAFVVLNYTGAQLQPAGSTDFVTTAIDADLAALRAYNTANPATPLRACLRTWWGANAPTWMLTMAGGPFTIADRNGHSVTIPAYWDAGVQAAQQTLVTNLGNRYDSEPLIARFSNPFSTSADDEPFIEAQNSATINSVAILEAAGRSDAAKLTSLQFAYTAFAAWPTTRIEYPCNVFSLMDSGSIRNNDTNTTAVMAAWRAALGARAVLSNHGLISPPSGNPHLAAVYQEFLTLGPTVSFQTEQAGMTLASVQRGLSFGATAIELWDGINGHTFLSVSAADLAAWAALFPAPVAYTGQIGGLGIGGAGIGDGDGFGTDAVGGAQLAALPF